MEGFPAKRVLRIAQISRSTYYYKAKDPSLKSKPAGRPVPGFSYNLQGKKIADHQVKEYLMALIEGETAIYGYRRLTKSLKKVYDLKINKKKVYRLCRELDILMPQRKKKTKYPRKLARNRIVNGPNQLWQLDIKYGYITTSRRFFYLASIIDVCDKTIIAHHKGKTCEAQHMVDLLHEALMRRQIYGQEQTLIIRTDNDSQFCSNAFQEFCAGLSIVEHERIPPRSPNMNAYIESFHSVLQRECYDRNEFQTFDEAFHVVDEYIEFYNQRRYHGSLNDCSPQEYFEGVLKGEIKVEKISL